MKNKILLSVALLASVIITHHATDRVTTITAKEFSDLVGINQLKKELELLEAKAQRTAKENEIIARLKAKLAQYDEGITDTLTELKKDAVKNAKKIKTLAAKKSEMITDKVVEEAKKGLSIFSQVFYFFRYKSLAFIYDMRARFAAWRAGL